MDWQKILVAIGTALARGCLTWMATSGRRIARNLGKTELALAEEQLDAALKRAEKAHANDNPRDDADADAAVAAAKRMRERARRLKAIADAVGEE